MITLGIESSCDETAVAIIDDTGKILSHKLITQFSEHAKYGGVVPEIASRAHLENIDALALAALDEARIPAEGVDAFAAGAGPGLIGGVIVGLNTAKALAFATGRPFVAVNHLEAHALMPMMFDESLEFPYLLLLVSGGHSQILLVEGVGKYKLLGTTIDDACGECFDKVAKMLGYGYMGGKYIERDANGGDPKAFDFPRPLAHSRDLNFSFSGLKTAVRVKLAELGELAPETRADVCASFEAAVCDVIEAKVGAAAKIVSRETIPVRRLSASGGVASNKKIRSALESVARENGMSFHAAPVQYCTDNGVMIAYAGLMQYEARGPSPLDFAPRPRWPLEELGK